MAQSDAELIISANSDGVKKGMNEAVSSVREGVAKMTEAAESFNGMIGGMTKAFTVFTEALMVGAVGEQFVEMVRKSAEVGDEMLKTSQKVGISIETISKLKYAAEMSDVSMENLSIGLKKLANNMEQAHQGSQLQKDTFAAMGIKVDDATGHLRNMDQVLPQIADKFAEMKDGTGKTAIAMALFGKSGADMIPFLNQGSKGMKEMGDEAERLGLVWDKETGEAAERLNDDITRVHASMEGVTTHIAQSFFPLFDSAAEVLSRSAAKGGMLNTVMDGTAEVVRTVFAGLGEVFSAIGNIISEVFDELRQTGGAVLDAFGQEKVSAMDIFKNAVSVVTAAFVALSSAVEITWQFANLFIGEIINVADGLKNTLLGAITSVVHGFAALGYAITGNLEQAKQSMKQAWDDLGKPVSKAVSDVEGYWDKGMQTIEARSEKAKAKIQSILMGDMYKPAKKAKTESGEGSGGADAPIVAQHDSAAASSMQQWETELARQKEVYQEQHDGYEMSLADVKKYWDGILATLDKGTKDYATVSRKSSELHLQILKQEHERGLASIQEYYDYSKQIALSDLDEKRQSAQQQFSLGQITKEELIQQEQQFEDRRFEIERQSLEERLALLEKDPNMNPVEYQKIKDQILMLERKHRLAMQNLGNQLQVEQKGPAMTVFKNMQDSFAGAITNMLARAQTFRQAMTGMFQSIFQSFVQKMVAEPLAEWAMGLVRQTALYQAFFGTKQALQTADAASAVATKATEATAVVGANAAEGASGAAASVASIPYVGWAMAAGVFASTMAMIMGAKSSISSAAGGFDIPSGLNPMTQLHEREMVLPAHIADPLRQSIASGDSLSGGHTFHFNIQAMDGRDVLRVLTNNSQHVASAMAKAVRNYQVPRSMR